MRNDTRRCSGCTKYYPNETFGRWKTCDKCRKRHTDSAGALDDRGNRKCPACGVWKPISWFDGKKRCGQCRAYHLDYHNRRRTSDPEYRRETESRVQQRLRQRIDADPELRARRNAARREWGRKTGRTKRHIGESITATCAHCGTLFTYSLTGSRVRTLCALCAKYSQEWLYYRLPGPAVALLRAKTACDICGSDKAGTKSGLFRIDHCHDTGVVRGVLCHPCNIALGCMKDQPERLRAAADYIERHHVKGVGAMD